MATISALRLSVTREAFDDFLDNKTWLAVVNFPGRANEARLVGGRVDNEPGVDGDAVTSDARPGREP